MTSREDSNKGGGSALKQGSESLARLTQFKFFRFGVVGATNGLIYAVVTALCISGFDLAAKFASLIGYMTALPFAFLAHRTYTFASRGLARHECPRFFVTQGVSLLVSVFAMGVAVDYLGLHYSMGIAAAIILVPVVTFLVMDIWVFSDQLVMESDKRKS